MWGTSSSAKGFEIKTSFQTSERMSGAVATGEPSVANNENGKERYFGSIARLKKMFDQNPR